MELNILGCYSASPRSDANPTSQVLTIKNRTFLLDCGEGTQRELRRNKISFAKIEHIFITHLHGDHVYGLIGFISTMALLKREKDLHVYGPEGIEELIRVQLRISESHLSYTIIFHELSSEKPQVIYEDKKLTVETIPLDHRVYTNGYLFKEKLAPRKLLIEEVEKYDIDISFYNNIKAGKDVVLDNGQVIPNKKLTDDPPAPKSYAFCTDTLYKPIIVEQIKNVTALYHESTFQEDNILKCKPTMHSTAKQAGLIAKKAKAGKLILGHYSSRYETLAGFKSEAETVFDHVVLAEDGKVIEI